MSIAPLFGSSGGGPPGSNDRDAEPPNPAQSAKKTYETPKLTVYGSVAEITQFFPPDHHHHHHGWMSRD